MQSRLLTPHCCAGHEGYPGPAAVPRHNDDEYLQSLLTVAVKAFDRPAHLIRALTSVRCYYPTVPIVVAGTLICRIDGSTFTRLSDTG
jgi:hypothetical protein